MKYIYMTIFLSWVYVTSVSYGGSKKPHQVTYEEVNHEQIFGIDIIDKFRWMENLDDPRLDSWIEKQENKFSQFIEEEDKNFFQNEFTKIYQKKEELKKDCDEDFYFDLISSEYPAPNYGMPEFGGSLTSPSKKYKIEQYSDSGSDYRYLRIFDQEKKHYLADIVKVKFFTVIWDNSEEFFTYVTDYDGRYGRRSPSIRRHYLNTQQASDEDIFVSKKYDVWLSLYKIDEDFYMGEEFADVIKLSKIDLTTGEISEFIPPMRGKLTPFGEKDNYIYLKSFVNSNYGRIVRVHKISGVIEVVVDEQAIVLDGAVLYEDQIFLTYINDASHIIKKYSLLSNELKQVKFEESGSIFFNKVKKELHVVHTHYNVAPTVWKVDHNKNIFTLVKESENPFPMDAYKIYYTAHNGKKVPIWILKKSDVVLSNKTPCYIYGYGGFRVNLLPAYNEEYLPWLKKGGCIAFVTLPGGLEYGENWHKEGAGLNKINVFNDFANAARTLYMNQVSSPDKAGIGGASNGGLLVAATMNLFPKLFQAAVPEVGVLDMTRFELFSGGKWWTKEYGTRYIKKDFHNLFNISPYHQLKPNKYPHTLVITSDLDDRVVPSHSYKYAAKLQELKPWDRVAYLYTRKLSSHSRKSGTINERIKYLSYKWSFLNKTLNW